MVKSIIFINCTQQEILSKLLQDPTAPDTQIIIIPPLKHQQALPIKTIQLTLNQTKKLLQTIQGTRTDLHFCTENPELEIILTLILAHVYNLSKITQITTKNKTINKTPIETLQPSLTEKNQQILTQLPDKITGLNHLAQTLKINPAQLSKTIKQLAQKGLIQITNRKPLQAQKTQTAKILTHIIKLRQKIKPRKP